MMSREATYEDFTRFFDYLHQNYPELEEQLQNKLFVVNRITALHPRTMSNTEYEDFNKYLQSGKPKTVLFVKGQEAKKTNLGRVVLVQ